MHEIACYLHVKEFKIFAFQKKLCKADDMEWHLFLFYRKKLIILEICFSDIGRKHFQT